MTETLRVISGGAQTTVQDAGRPGALQHGVPWGGAMDHFALAVANRLVGNQPGAAGLEILLGAVAFEVLRPTLLALTGATFGATWNDVPLPGWTTVLARPGDQIALSARRGGWGARAYLAVGGGVAVAPVLGSRSTYLPGRFGGLEGRPLRAGDVVSGGRATDGPIARTVHHRDAEDAESNLFLFSTFTALAGQHWSPELRPPYGPTPTLRYLPGPHQACFDPGAPAALAGTQLRVSEHANRIGYRLEGVRLGYKGEVSLPSLGVIPGVIQVPPDGAPILLMADAQTTGGYPIIGVVISPDLPLAAQLLPGDSLRLRPVSEQEALAARRAFVAWCAAEPRRDETLMQLGLAGALG